MSDEPEKKHGGPADPADRSRTIAFSGMGALVLLGLALIVRGPQGGAADPASPAAREAPAAVLESAVVAADAAAAPAAQVAPVAADAGPRPPAAWRVATLKTDPAIEVVEGAYGKHSLASALAQAGIGKAEMRRLVHAFEGVHRIEHAGPKESYVVAKDRNKGTIVAFEHVVSPSEVWQARTDDSARFIVKKVDLWIEQKNVSAALTITTDLAKAIAAAGLREEAASGIDDALEGHVDLAAIKPGVRLRVVAHEEWIEGAFTRFHVDAIEVTPKTGAASRIYFYERHAHGAYWNAKGQQPFEGTFRSPLPAARITSRFNPKRMHPVLHVVMPHNGIDFGASTGTPVYASASGTVSSAGNGGPCGNMVEIDHGSGLTTAYCHLSRFAPGLRAGQHVDARQLVGYVGQTGRATGPHLHFAVKRQGAFVDPLALKMDGVRVIPPSERDGFQTRRRELDAALDAIALPAASDAPDPSGDDDDKDEPAGEE